jgi:hypothetical protein
MIKEKGGLHFSEWYTIRGRCSIAIKKTRLRFGNKKVKSGIRKEVVLAQIKEGPFSDCGIIVFIALFFQLISKIIYSL